MSETLVIVDVLLILGYMIILLQIPPTSVAGDYRLRVEGFYDGVIGGTAFVNETRLTFSQRSMTIFIQTDKPIYMQGQNGKYIILLYGSGVCSVTKKMC